MAERHAEPQREMFSRSYLAGPPSPAGSFGAFGRGIGGSQGGPEGVQRGSRGGPEGVQKASPDLLRPLAPFLDVTKGAGGDHADHECVCAPHPQGHIEGHPARRDMDARARTNKGRCAKLVVVRAMRVSQCC
jgi:hypothetical protein